jgi:hypothetical protein
MADRTDAEWRAARTSPDVVKDMQPFTEYCFDWMTSSSDEEVQSVLREYGDSVDWRAKGAVTPVKNQGSHGTCWSFAATGIMEGISVAQGGNPLESVSEQELIDCYKPANTGRALDQYYRLKHLHPASEQSYPYRGSKSTCRRESSTLTKSAVKEVLCPWTRPDGNQDHLLAALVKYGPAGWMIESGGLRGYKSGIISNAGSSIAPNGTVNIDHATTLVGAGEENGVPYWLVKNSWGTSFGESGYYRAKRNTNPPQLGVPGGVYGVYDDSFVVSAIGV